MGCCAKCGKNMTEYLITVYEEKYCEDCYAEYLMTDRGKVEYLINIAKGIFSVNSFDPDFLGEAGLCWLKHKKDFKLSDSEINNFELKLKLLGIL